MPSVATAIDIVRYQPLDADRWDQFVEDSKNGTFLFFRRYMDYHADRFVDHSLLVIGPGGQIVALLPAHRADCTLVSHAGLSYGGFVTDDRMTQTLMVAVFDALFAHAAAEGLTKLTYKPVPHIYHAMPAEEDLYCLYARGARLSGRDVTTVVTRSCRPALQERRRRALQKARRRKLDVSATEDFSTFWPILSRNLGTRYALQPVHTIEEIQLLAGRFPNEIKLYAAYDAGVMLAGAVVYLTATTCHVQYNAASEEGRIAGALDAIVDRLLDEYSEKKYVDFGVSTEGGGARLNAGLVDYKEGFGARTIVQDRYELDFAS
jgi:GNAT acetyltransferase-like protein